VKVDQSIIKQEMEYLIAFAVIVGFVEGQIPDQS
jgi:hypothetical protein